jgi:hypothetical protein
LVDELSEGASLCDLHKAVFAGLRSAVAALRHVVLVLVRVVVRIGHIYRNREFGVVLT